MTLEECLTAKDVAKMLSMSAATIRELARRGEFPGVLGVGRGRGVLRFPRSCVEAYVARSRLRFHVEPENETDAG